MFPYLLKIGSFELRVYSLMLMAAVLIAIYFVSKKAAKIGLDPKLIENALIVSFAGGVIGARLYYVIFNWRYFGSNIKEIPAVWHGGLAIHGGIILGILSGVIYCRVKKIPLFTFMDLALPFFLLGQGIGRFGNFANGEAHGVPTFTPWEVIFSFKPLFPEFWRSLLYSYHLSPTPAGANALYNTILKGEANVSFMGKVYALKELVPWGVSFPATYMPEAYREFGSLPLHPTFFYEMLLNFLGAALLLKLWKNHLGTGRVAATYFVLYGLIRSFVTCFRADDLMLAGLRAPHAASLLLIIVGAAIFLYGRGRPNMGR